MAKIAFDPGLTQLFSGRVRRMINKDGTFNVRRTGIGLRDTGAYMKLMELNWPAFLAIVGLLYTALNLAFACLYFVIGVDRLQGADTSTPFDAFLSAFFFSVQTFTTVGYGHIAPKGIAANSLAALEAMTGLLGFALGTGLLFARFSRPRARFVFSRDILVAPFQGGRAVMFRTANRRPNVLMELEARLLLMTVEADNGQLKRRYQMLELERPNIYFLPLAWTLVHPIDEKSPLWGKTREDLVALQAEFLIMVKAFDDTFSQTVHARHSYTAEEVVWDARFLPAFRTSSDGSMVLDLGGMDAWERLPSS
jgi:inward rectifier potassium channel